MKNFSWSTLIGARNSVAQRVPLTTSTERLILTALWLVSELPANCSIGSKLVPSAKAALIRYAFIIEFIVNNLIGLKEIEKSRETKIRNQIDWRDASGESEC